MKEKRENEFIRYFITLYYFNELYLKIKTKMLCEL